MLHGRGCAEHSPNVPLLWYYCGSLWHLPPGVAAHFAVVASCLTLLQPAPKPIGTYIQAMQFANRMFISICNSNGRCDCLPLQEKPVKVAK
jgi:hypothetical protein